MYICIDMMAASLIKDNMNNYNKDNLDEDFEDFDFSGNYLDEYGDDVCEPYDDSEELYEYEDDCS